MKPPADRLGVTASAIVFREDTSEVCLVHHRRLGFWIYPGGHIRPGEHSSEAAKREVLEEVGFTPELVSAWKDAPPMPAASAAGLLELPIARLLIERAGRVSLDIVYAGVAPGPTRLRPEQSTLEAARWVPKGVVSELVTPPELPMLIRRAWQTLHE